MCLVFEQLLIQYRVGDGPRRELSQQRKLRAAILLHLFLLVL